MAAAMKMAKDVAGKALVLLGVGHCVTEYVGELTMCVGPSMMPTFNRRGDIVLAEMLTPRFGEFQRGDIVVATSPRNPKQLICKRIVALEGERVCKDPSKHPRKFVTIPRNHVWLRGDNAMNSTDSRTYGPVCMSLIRSRVVAKVWPPLQAGALSRSFDPELVCQEPEPLPVLEAGTQVSTSLVLTEAKPDEINE